jgi:hypothetical protein
VTVYESLIKVDIADELGRRASDIVSGLAYTAVILIDEYGYTFDQVSDALDNARNAAEDEWYELHPSDGDDDE